MQRIPTRVERFLLGSLRALSKETQPPVSELEPGSAFVVVFCLTGALLRLLRVTPVLVFSVHR
jgi:hypothetical protein